MVFCILPRSNKYTNTEEFFHQALSQASVDEVGSSTAGGTDSSWGDGMVEERLESQMEGLAIFEGGSYSLGPTSLGEGWLWGVGAGGTDGLCAPRPPARGPHGGWFAPLYWPGRNNSALQGFC